MKTPFRKNLDKRYISGEELKLECIAAAEYYGLNDLADDMEYDLEIN